MLLQLTPNELINEGSNRRTQISHFAKQHRN